MRMTGGVIFLLMGVVLILAWAIPYGGAIAWIVSLAPAANGAFMIFEARAGWCVIRAMGWKTRI